MQADGMLATTVRSGTRGLQEAFAAAIGHSTMHSWITVAAADLEGDAQVEPRSIVVRHHHPDAARRLACHLPVPDGDDARLCRGEPPEDTSLHSQNSQHIAELYASSHPSHGHS
jgi:hypothetical protein